MRCVTMLSLTIGLTLSGPTLAQDRGDLDGKLNYPETRTIDLVEEQFGEYVSDPYRWLENDVREDEKVANWVEAQNEVTEAYLITIQPQRDALAASMTELFDYDELDVPVRAGDKYFYTRKSGGQNQSILYVKDGSDGSERVLVDPSKWSEDGATALAEWKPSPDGSHLVYAIQDGGSDWRTLKVLNVKDGTLLPDEVKWVKYSGLAWMPGNIGFLYSRFPEPEKGEEFQSLTTNHNVYLHRLNSDQNKDLKIFETSNQPELSHEAGITSDREWIVIRSSSGTDEKYAITLIKVDAPKLETRKLVDNFDNDWELIDGVGDTLYLKTDKDAPRGRVVKIDLAKEGSDWVEIVPEHSATLAKAKLVGEQIAANYIDDAKNRLELFSLDGNPLGLVNLPGIGRVDDLGGSAKSDTGYFAFDSFNRPRTIYSFSAAGAPAVWAKPELPFDPSLITVTQQFYQSKDGTKVPMFLVHKKDMDLANGAPTLLYGYGGFNISVLPQYKPAWLAWIKAGGVFASANIRGGGEYGKEWHDAGRLNNKQNVFDDFIAAGEYLKATGVTPKDGLAIEGRSNGGLLVGAVFNQRPDLFAAGHAAVGVMDMLRFDQFTAGRYWVDDYGYPNKEADFKNLLTYSPYHNIMSGTEYPPLMVTTADTDDRVVPGHSFKYIARMQALNTGSAPHLIRIESRAGHGSGKPTDKLIEEYSDIYAFLADATNLMMEK
ncbi:MAG: prolyl oligopeptidase family serine peptidase [Parasphingorhabdus sp.]